MSPHARADDRPGHNERLDNLYRSESFCCACCDGAFRAINRCCCTSIERRHKPASQGDRILREAVISFCRSTLSTLPVRVPESPQRAASADHFELPLKNSTDAESTCRSTERSYGGCRTLGTNGCSLSSSFAPRLPQTNPGRIGPEGGGSPRSSTPPSFGAVCEGTIPIRRGWLMGHYSNNCPL